MPNSQGSGTVYLKWSEIIEMIEDFDGNLPHNCKINWGQPRVINQDKTIEIDYTFNTKESDMDE
jgi:hypothetical protein